MQWQLNKGEKKGEKKRGKFSCTKEGVPLFLHRYGQMCWLQKLKKLPV